MSAVLALLLVAVVASADAVRHAAAPLVAPSAQAAAVRALASRVLPGHAVNQIELDVDPSLAGGAAEPVFTLDSGSGQIAVRIVGSSGVAAARGLYHYLKFTARVQVTWGVDGSGSSIGALPATLPPQVLHARIAGPDAFRYYMNVCTVSYSAAWWSWSRWETEIDWMALHGVNLPLTFTGQEIVWRQLWREQNLTDAEINQWFAGPAFLAWQRMGNLRLWAGPLSEHWMNSQAQLGVQIAQRQAELGMVNVLPGFAGHVPAGLKRVYPRANITQSPNWWGAPAQDCCDYLLEPRDPLFTSLGRRFYELITAKFGKTSVFNADTFNEMLPASSDPTYLAETSAAVYGALAAYDPTAVWLMQGWLFVNDPNFWTQAAIEAYLSGAPNNNTLILDLWSEVVPVWSKTQSYYGKSFIWCMLHNFGGNRDLYGNLGELTTGVVAARNAQGSTMVGTGLTPEAIEQNPVMYELMTDMGFFAKSPDINLWLEAYVEQRYNNGGSMQGYVPGVQAAWAKLLIGAYSNVYMTDSAITHVPSLSMPTHDQARQNFTLQVEAWRLLQPFAAKSDANGPLKYDALDLLRQVLCNLFEDARALHAGAFIAHRAQPSARPIGDVISSLEGMASLISRIILALDGLLATNNNYLLGQWTSTARAWAGGNDSPGFLQFNALNQITLWGPNGEINDYAAKQWQGLVRDYYHGRWIMFTNEIVMTVKQQTAFNQTAFNDAVFSRDLAWDYANNQTHWSSTAVGDQATTSAQITAEFATLPNKFVTVMHDVSLVPSSRLYQTQTMTRDVASLGVLCAADPHCWGFTSDGYFANSPSVTLSPASGVTFYPRN